MTIRQAILALKKMCDVRIEDELIYMWLSELDGRVQTEIMLMDIFDVIAYSEEKYDANLMILPPHDNMYIDWLMYRVQQYYGEYERAEYIGAEFDKKYRKYAAWYMNAYRPAERKRKEQERWETSTVQTD